MVESTAYGQGRFIMMGRTGHQYEWYIDDPGTTEMSLYNRGRGGYDLTFTGGNARFYNMDYKTTTGNFKLGAGESAGSPPYAFYNDSNTGMYRVANGKLGIVGVGSLVATFDGNTDNVGIGTDSPDRKLQIRDTVSGTRENLIDVAGDAYPTHAITFHHSAHSHKQ